MWPHPTAASAARRIQGDSRGAITDLHETGGHQDGPVDELHRIQTERRHQKTCSLNLRALRVLRGTLLLMKDSITRTINGEL